MQERETVKKLVCELEKARPKERDRILTYLEGLAYGLKAARDKREKREEESA